MIIDTLQITIDKFIEYDNQINRKLNNYYRVTDDMREEAKTSNFMKIKIFIFENRKIIGIILFTIFLFQIINYFDNKSNSNVYTVPKCKAQKGGAVGAVVVLLVLLNLLVQLSVISATGANNAVMLFNEK